MRFACAIQACSYPATHRVDIQVGGIRHIDEISNKEIEKNIVRAVQA
jgi:hypothetical protein